MSTLTFDTFDEKIAEMMIRAHDAPAGLPGFLGITFDSLTAGKLVATMPVRPELVTPMGAVHGGVMAGFVDHLLGCVLYPLMKRGQWAATTEFKLNYLRAVKTGTLTGEAVVMAFGRRSAVVRVDVTNDDALACIAQGTLLVSDPPSSK
jgi:uncharacterized protein (TIGR00369 family)